MINKKSLTRWGVGRVFVEEVRVLNHIIEFCKKLTSTTVDQTLLSYLCVDLHFRKYEIQLIKRKTWLPVVIFSCKVQLR